MPLRSLAAAARALEPRPRRPARRPARQRRRRWRCARAAQMNAIFVFTPPLRSRGNQIIQKSGCCVARLRLLAAAGTGAMGGPFTPILCCALPVPAA
jgi:hypothetical protein